MNNGGTLKNLTETMNLAFHNATALKTHAEAVKDVITFLMAVNVTAFDMRDSEAIKKVDETAKNILWAFNYECQNANHITP
jgi:uncharacterized protein YggL (DUF469 family)